MKNNREYVFWFHYNKPVSSKANKPQITVHYRNTCYICDNIICNVSTYGHLKNQQPRFVIKGRCKSFEIKDNIAYIN